MLGEAHIFHPADLPMEGFTKLPQGKVRACYATPHILCLIAHDTLSAFDCLLPQCIPCKGQVLNQLSAYWFEKTRSLVPSWWLGAPHARISVGWRCAPFRVELIVRGYLAGHAARCYEKGARSLCGETLPNGLKPYERLPKPILTPTTKADKDQDISSEDILKRGLMTPKQYEQARDYALKLYAFGHAHAEERGLILVDAKYEFGLCDGKVLLIDELHTPDSARYFYKDDYETAQKEGRAPKQFSKEFIRQWLIEHDAQGTKATLNETLIQELAHRYINVYEQLTHQTFQPEMVQPKDLGLALRRFLKSREDLVFSQP